MKKIIASTIIILAALGAWYFFRPAGDYLSRLPAEIRNFASSSLPSLSKLNEEVFTPPPLKSNANHQDATLTVSGVIKYTNLNRAQNGNLPALKENTQLDKAAKAKLDDMFNQQYFEHESPDGKGPADVAKAAGYQYVLIGENLALGNFKNDEDLVMAWMNSPGHRANILKENFEEIGVAVGQGMYEGKKTWMAVQEFGRPRSSCPSVDSSLKIQINDLQNDVNNKQAQLVQLKAEMDNSKPKTQQEYDAYNKKVEEYNYLVRIYNNTVDMLKQKTAQYNTEVNAYNSCIGS